MSLYFVLASTGGMVPKLAYKTLESQFRVSLLTANDASFIIEDLWDQIAISVNTLRRLTRLSPIHLTHCLSPPPGVKSSKSAGVGILKRSVHVKSDGRISVWRKPKEELSPKTILPTVKHGGGGIMVCGCFAASGMENSVSLKIIWTNISILKENLKISAQKLGIQNTFKLYQDNYPKHTALNVRL
ncbi:hypothetical protein AVEN_177498-1 [Araneus ventricosus]|uniref:Transposable element Tc1 transposase n=1 Tax=Araneus ventricosus TaxID=182803 RepID=A0A4Y2D0K2_ARAVE|nr:hypothetical protein AVEN_177498-1 [Araneus ventricosus]